MGDPVASKCRATAKPGNCARQSTVGRGGKKEDANLAPSFVEDTANKTGQFERKVRPNARGQPVQAVVRHARASDTVRRTLPRRVLGLVDFLTAP